jgi:hypothetical protein
LFPNLRRQNKLFGYNLISEHRISIVQSTAGEMSVFLYVRTLFSLSFTIFFPFDANPLTLQCYDKSTLFTNTDFLVLLNLVFNKLCEAYLH